MKLMEPGSINFPLSPPNPTQVQKTLFIADLTENASFTSTFLVRTKERMLSRNGKPYLSLHLGDKTGTIDTRVWERADELFEGFNEGDVVAVAGKTHVFQNRLQLVVSHLAAVPLSEVTLSDYLPSSNQDLDHLYSELLNVFANLTNPWIRDLALALLTDPEIAERYKICPAAKTVHHAFVGGLLVHSLQLIKLVEVVHPLYPVTDKERLIFGAAFHDFGKIYELSFQNGFGYTDEGRLVGHISIGATLLDRKIRELPGFPDNLAWELKHIILSHHGRLEYGSPKRPHTLEALLVHHLDDMDSKMNSIETFMREEKSTARWTSHHRAYDNYYYKPDSLA
jgi:3'-5' exoribonuclease